MRIRAGYNIAFETEFASPLLLMLNLRPEREADLVTPQVMHTDPVLLLHRYIDGFGNVCTRAVIPPGRTRFSADFLIDDPGLPDAVAPDAVQHPVADLPDGVIVFLLASRYCDTELLGAMAWDLFGHVPPGWSRAQAIATYVHEQIGFDYAQARPTRTAHQAHEERVGVCRDYAHLMVALCRCMNIPARYCTGYMGDIGIAPVGVMDFSAWCEVYLGGAWRTFDARHNFPRIGRLMMAYGRDAADVALATTFGPSTLAHFEVITQQVG